MKTLKTFLTSVTTGIILIAFGATLAFAAAVNTNVMEWVVPKTVNSIHVVSYVDGEKHLDVYIPVTPGESFTIKSVK